MSFFSYGDFFPSRNFRYTSRWLWKLWARFACWWTIKSTKATCCHSCKLLVKNINTAFLVSALLAFLNRTLCISLFLSWIVHCVSAYFFFSQCFDVVDSSISVKFAVIYRIRGQCGVRTEDKIKWLNKKIKKGTTQKKGNVLIMIYTSCHFMAKTRIGFAKISCF